MAWTDEALDRLASSPSGYHDGSSPAAEPTALAALALVGAGRIDDACIKLRWLMSNQKADGLVAPLSQLESPGWPTPLAILASAAVADANGSASSSGKNEPNFDHDKAQEWLLAAKGTTSKRLPDLGHDTTLVGWPWVLATHSWQEPTAWSVLALCAVGLNEHPRTREGVKLLVDRLLPTGGCNYGNTFVFGQKLRPHVEPTGITLVALRGENIDDPRLERSLKYLLGALSEETTPNSLAYGLLGLAAHARDPALADTWLESAYRSTIARDPSPLSLALLVLAAQGPDCALIRFAHGSIAKSLI